MVTGVLKFSFTAILSTNHPVTDQALYITADESDRERDIKVTVSLKMFESFHIIGIKLIRMLTLTLILLLKIVYM
jgi:hypothetical protein